MADLIINISLEESRKKHGLVIETYEGTILHLKSKKFSGQLRNINLSSASKFDNLSFAELQLIKDAINDPANTQISKFQYICSVGLFPKINSLVKIGCFFSKDKKGSMYEIENIYINTNKKGLGCISDFSALQEKTILYVNYDITNEKTRVSNTEALFYIDISSKRYRAELFFDYGKDLIKAESKELVLNNEKKYRDYKVEQEIIGQIKECHWKLQEKAFLYEGKDIAGDLLRLRERGICLFTNERKKINVLDFSTTSVSYGIDWFEIKGEAKAGDFDFNIGELVDFRKKKNDWTEYKGQILFVPSELKKLAKIEMIKDGNNLKVSTSDILEAFEIVNYLGKGKVSDYSALSKFEDITLRLPGRLNNTLRNYQKTGVKWLLYLRKNGLGGCLADDMGLGKTIQVISYLSDASQKMSKALIVVPKTLLENWSREIQKFSTNLSYYIYHGAGRNVEDAEKSRIIVTTYGTLLNDIATLGEFEYDHLIIDEAQNIKNSKTKAYRAIAQIKASTKIIMTGTPLENNIQEYWDLMKIANPTRLSLKTISAGLEDNQVVEKIQKLTAPFLLRRLKKDVLLDLPEKQEQIVYCDFDTEQKHLYDNILESIKQELRRSPDRFEMKSNSIVLNGLLYLQEICCHPRLLPREYNVSHCMESAKTEQLLSMLKELYYSGHKVVVFSRFTRMLEIINTEVSKLHFNSFYLDGNTRNRQKVVDEFEISSDGIFLVSLKAGGVGLNLVSADSVIIYDPWWNPAVEKQAEDRIYRIGQKNKVTVYKLVVANTIEEKIQTLQETKRKLFDDIVDGHDVPRNITVNDIMNLINENPELQ